MEAKPSVEEVNFSKFVNIVFDEFPKALRQTFISMWDRKVGALPGYQLWDDSVAVRYMLLASEGGKTDIPINKSIQEWDNTALFKATIFAKTFRLTSSTGAKKTLAEFYLKGRTPPSPFHPTVNCPCGDQDETLTLAINQLRLLRNTIVRGGSARITKIDFDQYVQLAKEAFIALGVSCSSIDMMSVSDIPVQVAIPRDSEMAELPEEHNYSMAGSASSDAESSRNSAVPSPAFSEEGANFVYSLSDQEVLKFSMKDLNDLVKNPEDVRKIKRRRRTLENDGCVSEDLERLARNIRFEIIKDSEMAELPEEHKYSMAGSASSDAESSRNSAVPSIYSLHSQELLKRSLKKYVNNPVKNPEDVSERQKRFTKKIWLKTIKGMLERNFATMEQQLEKVTTKRDHYKRQYENLCRLVLAQ